MELHGAKDSMLVVLSVVVEHDVKSRRSARAIRFIENPYRS
jgi:hypothetical protein